MYGFSFQQRCPYAVYVALMKITKGNLQRGPLGIWQPLLFFLLKLLKRQWNTQSIGGKGQKLISFAALIGYWDGFTAHIAAKNTGSGLKRV